MNNALMTSNGFALDFTQREVLNTIKATVAKDLTDAELALFIEHCKGTRLNPYKKEVWAIKAGGRLQVMTGIAGFLAIANNHPMFDGMEVEVDNDEKPTKATCRVWRKDRKFPAVGVALLKEYGRETPIWKQMPRVMLTKVAKSIAIREAFPTELNGIYTEEEMPQQFAQPTTKTIVVEPTQEPVSTFEQVTSSGQHYYDLSLVDEDKRDKAQKLIESANGSHVDDNVWSTTQELKPLSRVKLTAEQAASYLEHFASRNDD